MLKVWKGLSPEELRIAKAEYRKKHPENLKRKKAAARKYYKANKKKIRKKNSEWTRANPRKLLAAQLQRLYGLSLEEFNRLLIEQCGLCRICQKQMTGPIEPCADHDHETKKVRGLLCSNCNKGLGFFGDRISNLEAAIKYLRREL